MMNWFCKLCPMNCFSNRKESLRLEEFTVYFSYFERSCRFILSYTILFLLTWVWQTRLTAFKVNIRETEGEIKNIQSRDTGNIGHTGRRQTIRKTTTQLRKLKRWATRVTKVIAKRKQLLPLIRSLMWMKSLKILKRQSKVVSRKTIQWIETYISNLVRMTHFWDNLHHVCLISKD